MTLSYDSPMSEEGTASKPATEAECQRDTKVEYVRNPADTAEVRDMILFVDKKTDRIGLMDPQADGESPGRYQVPLSDVLDLLRRGVI